MGQPSLSSGIEEWGTFILGLWLAVNIKVDLLAALRLVYRWLETITFSLLGEGTDDM